MSAARSSGLRKELAAIGPLDLALLLTLVALLLQPIGSWAIRPFVLLLAAGALLLPGWVRSPVLWWSLLLLAALRVALAWPLPDNHAYLLIWWCLACALALHTSAPERTLATSVRALIGLSFALALVWKAALSPDFLDSTFFRVTLLLDTRFHGLTELVGGLSPQAIEAARGSLAAHIDGPSAAEAPSLELSARFRALAALATAWTLATELAVALTFLWPGRSGPARLRDACLLVFCASTYAFATVAGFGWLLLAMGAAQCAPDKERTRWLYLLVFALILLYRELPWADLLRSPM